LINIQKQARKATVLQQPGETINTHARAKGEKRHMSAEVGECAYMANGHA